MVKITNNLKLLTGIATGVLAASSLSAAEIDTNIAQMQAMDKITGRVSVIDVPVNGQVNFGSFSIVVRACKTRPPEDTPENFAFVDVVDNYNSETPVNIFRGWMISSSPALNPVEHPIYDVWLLKCINGSVEPSRLLSKQELDARDKLPKAPAFNAEAKLKDVDESLESIAKEENIDATAVDKIIPPQTTEKDVATQDMPEAQLQNHSISNPLAPAVEENIEPLPQEDGAPKSLINIGNDFVPETEENVEKDADASAGSEKALLSEETLPQPEEKKAETPQNANEGFLNNFLNISDDGSEEVFQENNSVNIKEDTAPSSSENGAAVDVDEIDKELMQLQ